AFAEKFKAKYKNDPAGYDIYGYDFANIIANAIVKAGSTDKDKIIDTMHKQAVPGLLIPEYKFDENGDVINGPLYIYTVDKGNFKLIEQWKEWRDRRQAAHAPSDGPPRAAQPGPPWRSRTSVRRAAVVPSAAEPASVLAQVRAPNGVVSEELC